VVGLVQYRCIPPVGDGVAVDWTVAVAAALAAAVSLGAIVASGGTVTVTVTMGAGLPPCGSDCWVQPNRKSDKMTNKPKTRFIR
jgi:hypothetical protein